MADNNLILQLCVALSNVVWVESITNPEYRKGVTAKVVSFVTASRNGEPFEAMIKKHGIPNITQPHCTR